MQRELLPQEVPDVPGLQIAAYSRPALGLTEEAEYTERMVPFGDGDMLTLYTDGIPESFDLKGEQFGQDRLEALFRTAAPFRRRKLCESCGRHSKRLSASIRRRMTSL